MDITEYELRFAEVLPDMFAVGDDGVVRISSDFENLLQEVEKSLQRPDSPDALRELATSMRLLKDSLSDQDVATTVAQTLSAPLDPDPAIFDAIDEGDIEAVRKELETWDVNERVGKYEATALYRAMAATWIESLDIINLLLDAGADPKKGLTDSNVLHGLGFANQQKIDPKELSLVVRRCVDMGADIEQRTSKLRWTPLITAVSEWNPVATEALLLAGADITARAGDVDGVCFAGADSFSFADGHDETMAVLKRFSRAS